MPAELMLSSDIVHSRRSDSSRRIAERKKGRTCVSNNSARMPAAADRHDPLYAPLPLSIMSLDKKNLCYGGKCLYARLFFLTRRGAQSWTGKDRELAEMLGCKKGSIRKLREKLRKLNLLSWVSRGDANEYTLRRPPLPDEQQFGRLYLRVLQIPIGRVSFASKVLHAALCWQRRNGPCFPGHETLGKDLACTGRNVRNMLPALEAAGLAIGERRRRTSTNYRLSDRPNAKCISTTEQRECYDSSADGCYDSSGQACTILPPKKGVLKEALKKGRGRLTGGESQKTRFATSAFAHS